ncbi:hypothetical protein MASR2M15_29080 [Anaerolineales bacterium]
MCHTAVVSKPTLTLSPLAFTRLAWFCRSRHSLIATVSKNAGREAGRAFEEVAFLNENQRFTFSVTHLYFDGHRSGWSQGRQHTAHSMDGIDAYLEAWRMDMTLGDRLA